MMCVSVYMHHTNIVYFYGHKWSVVDAMSMLTWSFYRSKQLIERAKCATSFIHSFINDESKYEFP